MQSNEFLYTRYADGSVFCICILHLINYAGVNTCATITPPTAAAVATAR